MLSDSESELFVTQSSFSGSTSIELSENKEKAVDNFNLRTEDLLTDLFTDKEDSGQGTSWSTRVWDDWVTERNSLPINDSDTFVVAPNSGILNTLCNFRTVVLAEQVCVYICKFVLHKKANLNARGLCVNMQGG